MKRLIILSLCSLFLIRCSLSDNDPGDVAYLIINETDLTTNIDQGFPSHQIEDVWIYVDEQALGVYTIPARIPVIPKEGEVTIRIAAGVKPNGSKNESITYPFYDQISIQHAFVTEEEFVYKPVFKVSDNAKFDFIDEFEGGTIFTQDLDGNSETLIIKSSLDKKGGSFSGLIELANDKKIAEFTTESSYLSANNAGGATFLEFDYKSDTDIFVGYILNTGTQIYEDYEAVFVPQDEWTRVYIDFTNYMTNNDVVSYRVKFYMEHLGAGTSQVFLDNAKLVHF